MTTSNAIKAIESMLRIQLKKKQQKCKETKGFSPPSFDRFIFICSDIITSNTVTCCARILQAN